MPGQLQLRRAHLCLSGAILSVVLCACQVLSSKRMADKLMGLAEVARALGVSRARADQLARQVGFPAPVATLIGGRIWEREAVEAWARKAGRAK